MLKVSESKKAGLASMFVRAWTDPGFKARLLADPKEVLSEIGISIDEDIEIGVVENTEGKFHILLPEAPADLQSMETMLEDSGYEMVAGGCTKILVTCTFWNPLSVKVLVCC